MSAVYTVVEHGHEDHQSPFDGLCLAHGNIEFMCDSKFKIGDLVSSSTDDGFLKGRIVEVHSDEVLRFFYIIDVLEDSYLNQISLAEIELSPYFDSIENVNNNFSGSQCKFGET